MDKYTLPNPTLPIRRAPALAGLRSALLTPVGWIPGFLKRAEIVSAIVAIVILIAVVNGNWLQPSEGTTFTGPQVISSPELVSSPDLIVTPLMQIAILVMGGVGALALIVAIGSFISAQLRAVSPVILAALGVVGMVAGIAYLSQHAPPPALMRYTDIGFWVALAGTFALIVQGCIRRDFPSLRARFILIGTAFALNVTTYLIMLVAEVSRSRINESVAFEITALLGLATYGAVLGGFLTGYIFSRKGYNVWTGRLIGAGLGAVGNLFLLIPIWLHMPYREGAERKRIRLDEIIYAAIFLSPWIVGFILLNVHPLIDSYRVSLYNWRGIGEPTQYVGLRHIQTVIEDPFFWQSFKNTVVYTAVLVPIQLTLTLLLAMVLNRPRMRGAVIYRTLYFLPVVTSVSVVAVIMRLILGNFGSGISTLFGIDPPVNPISSPQLALPSVILFGLWHSFGINLVYFLAALQTVPAELYDAAKVDGANWWQEIWYITLPGIRPISTVILFMAIIGSMGVFEQSFVLTRGGPYFASQVVSGYIYGYAFRAPGTNQVPNLGYASAAALFFSTIMLVLTAFNYFVINRMRRKQA